MRKNHLTILSLILFFLLSANSAPAQDYEDNSTDVMPSDTTTLKLLHFMKNVRGYDFRTPQEKVYLHLDNNAYFVGETLWFKAYVVRASSLKPSTLSHVAYVELVSPLGQIVDRRTLKVEDGEACGDFDLSKLLHSGFYEIRAYTREMLNWDASYVFSRVIPIFNKPKTSADYDKPTFYLPKDGLPLLSDRPLRDTVGRVGDLGIKVAFYPEGGTLAEGVTQRIGFLLTDTLGSPLNLKCSLLDKDHNFVKQFEPNRQGIGVFELPPSAEGGSLRILSSIFPLPRAEKGHLALTIYGETQGDSVDALIQSPQGMTDLRLAVCVTCRGHATFVNVFNLAGGEVKMISVPRNKLDGGVNQLTIYDESGNVLAERLFFQMPKNKPLALDYIQDKPSYSACSPVDMGFRLRTKEGKSVKTHFSLAIHDPAGDKSKSNADMLTNLLLTSDLRGYIASPQWYFEKDDSLHRSELDHLLLVQGWRRYDFGEMAMTKPFVRKQPIEDHLYLIGRIAKKWNPEAIGSKVNLALGLYNPQEKDSLLFGQCVTDTAGRFIFKLPDAYGEWDGEFHSLVNGRKKNYHVMLNRNFSPTCRFLYQPELHVTPLNARDTIATDTTKAPVSLTAQEDYEKMSNRKQKVKDHQLGMASVRARRKQTIQNSMNGGEAVGIKYGDRYYDLHYELEAMADAGQIIDTMTVQDWLKHKFGKDYFHGRLQGRNVLAILFNDARYGINPSQHYLVVRRDIRIMPHEVRGERSEIQPQTGEIIKSIIFSEDMSAIHNFTQTQDTHLLKLGFFTNPIAHDDDEGLTEEQVNRRLEADIRNNKKPILLFLYPEHYFVENDSHGSQRSWIHTFSKPKTFVSPYYGSAMPAVPDDYRRTLYWEPNVETDEDGHAQIHFYTNSRKQTRAFGISATAITADGQMLDYQK